ncbi:MAG TPA: hypothetical protein VJZ27_11115, partial [Aggregatilineales bacterium]|nr:hypothetical protein [Aggregatilineales bacterium]
SIRTSRTQGDVTIRVNLFAPGNLFLQQFDMDENGVIVADDILLPVEGRYIVQVSRTDEALSSAEGIYELTVEQKPIPLPQQE